MMEITHLKKAPFISVIVPAYGEERQIQRCLISLIDQAKCAPSFDDFEVLICDDGSTDGTVLLATRMCAEAAACGISMRVLRLARSGKAAAMNAGDHMACGQCRVYLDADVVLGPGAMAGLADVLSCAEPIFATPHMQVEAKGSWLARSYALTWVKLVNYFGVVTGIGCYAVNAEGRRRWCEFPQILSDDRFARLQFAFSERKLAAGFYVWPAPANLRRVVSARTRWTCGNRQLEALLPERVRAEDRARRRLSSLCRVALQRPLGVVVFIAVWIAAVILSKARRRRSAAWTPVR